MILAGDIGGTKTNMAMIRCQERSPVVVGSRPLPVGIMVNLLERKYSKIENSPNKRGLYGRDIREKITQRSGN